MEQAPCQPASGRKTLDPPTFASCEGARTGCPRTLRGPRTDTVRTVAPLPALVLVRPRPIASGLFRETGGCNVAKRFPPKTALALIAASLLAGPALAPAQAVDAPAAQAQKIPELKY